MRQCVADGSLPTLIVLTRHSPPPHRNCCIHFGSMSLACTTTAATTTRRAYVPRQRTTIERASPASSALRRAVISTQGSSCGLPAYDFGVPCTVRSSNQRTVHVLSAAFFSSCTPRDHHDASFDDAASDATACAARAEPPTSAAASMQTATNEIFIFFLIMSIHGRAFGPVSEAVTHEAIGCCASCESREAINATALDYVGTNQELPANCQANCEASLRSSAACSRRC
ncbi:hypothetical protein PUN4_50072 [Paraburkholderia unamae]|nr:hypothetical protein PUN4_50072 [Paraburkholderia unamae]